MSISFTPVKLFLRPGVTDNRIVRRGLDRNRLLGEPVEQQPASIRASPVEPKSEFVEVVIEVLLLDAALVSAEQPPLEKRDHSVNPRHDFVGWIQTVADDGDLVLVAGVRQPGIPAPSVGVDCRPRRHDALNEGEKAIRRHILDAPKADPADGPTALFGGHGDKGLGFGAPTTLALFRASDVGFVDFYRPRETIQAGPSPRRSLCSQVQAVSAAAKPQCPLQPERADAVLLTGDEPHRKKPHSQRFARILEHRASGQRRLPLVGATSQPSARHPPRVRGHAAFRAQEPVGPTQATDVLPASSVATKPLIHLLERPWIIDPRNGVALSLHRIFIPPKLAGVKGIPNKANICKELSHFLSGAHRAGPTAEVDLGRATLAAKVRSDLMIKIKHLAPDWQCRGFPPHRQRGGRRQCAKSGHSPTAWRTRSRSTFAFVQTV